ncbi:MAG: sigma-70 family RNA polymerase sigma factor [Muribaculaceae bacterium]|nr:sigma-70 family RNA polymerase sigma factor [Muribaculaceae bacterium]
MRTKTSDTEQLVAGLQQGNRRAYVEAMNRYGRLVSSITGAMASDPRDVEELTQDAFVRAFRTIGSFDSRKAALSTWLGRIAYNAAVDYLRRKGIRPAEYAAESLPEPPAEPDNMLSELLDDALELIAAEERTALQLVYFDGMSLEEAAYVLDTNANALSTRLYRIRNKLARIINELKRKQ